MSRNESECWTAKPLSTLQASTRAMPWLWYGYIARDSLTLFTGLWKAGKTTLVSHLLVALRQGGPPDFAGQAVTPARVIVVTEESERDWLLRRDELALGDHVSVISRPFIGRPDGATWRRFIANVTAQVAASGCDLVIIDSLPNLWPVQDENDAAQVITALTPLYGITKAGAGVLLIAHPRKGDAGEAQAMRGSGATAAFVDVIVELRRYDPERRADNRRKLTAYSRYDDTPGELVVDFDPGTGYRAVGTTADATTGDRLAVVSTLLPSEGPGITVEELRAAWPGEATVARPGIRTLKTDLRHAIQTPEACIECSGAGVRGDPYRYRLADPFPASSTTVDRSAQESAPDSIPASSNTGDRHTGTQLPATRAAASMSAAGAPDDEAPAQYPEYAILDGGGGDRRVIPLRRREAGARRGVR